MQGVRAIPHRSCPHPSRPLIGEWLRGVCFLYREPLQVKQNEVRPVALHRRVASLTYQGEHLPEIQCARRAPGMGGAPGSGGPGGDGVKVATEVDFVAAACQGIPDLQGSPGEAGSPGTGGQGGLYTKCVDVAQKTRRVSQVP